MKFYHGDDTWKYFESSLDEYQKLLHDPFQFVKAIFIETKGQVGLEAVYDTKNSFWNNLSEVLFIKMLAVFNVFSFGNYFVDVVLFCFVVYLGNLLLFRLLVQRFPSATSLLIVVIFYLPVPVFWLSGIRKDGLLLVALAMALFYFDRLLRKQRSLIRDIILFLSGLIGLYLLRNLMMMCLLPALLAWFLCRTSRIPTIVSFLGVHMMAIVLFFASGTIPGLPDLAQKVVNRQQDFLNLKANTRLPLDSLKASPSSYLQILPQAFNHAMLRPYITESKGILQVISALDVIFFLTAMTLAFLFRDRKIKAVYQDPVILTCISISLAGCILIGYTVPFPGAIVRYKVIFELLFLCVLAILIKKPTKKFDNIMLN